jgi:hypothetical protein
MYAILSLIPEIAKTKKTPFFKITMTLKDDKKYLLVSIMSVYNNVELLYMLININVKIFFLKNSSR